MEVIKEKFSENLMSLIYIIAGIIMIFNPKFICDAVNYVIGGLVILLGVIYIIKLLQTKDLKQFSKIELLLVLLCFGLGLFIMFNTSLLISILPIGCGLLIFIDAISQIIKSFKLKKNRVKLWYINLMVGLILFAFSLYFILNAKDVTYLIIRLIGIVLIIDAIFEFYTSFKIKRLEKNIRVIDTEIVEIKKIDWRKGLVYEKKYNFNNFNIGI